MIKLILITLTFFNVHASDLFEQSLQPNSPQFLEDNQMGNIVRLSRLVQANTGRQYDLVQVRTPQNKWLKGYAHAFRQVIQFKEKLNQNQLNQFFSGRDVSLIRCMRPANIEKSICLVNSSWSVQEVTSKLDELKSDPLVLSASRDWIYR
jgi:hypothetical protein